MDTATDIHPVLREIRLRTSGKATNNRLALSVEGGAVRGIVSAAMLQSLRKIGIGPEVFDEIYGVSAGAINATTYIAGNMDAALSSYVDAKDKRIVRGSRVMSRRPVINVSLLVERVMSKLSDGELQKIFDSNRLRILATNAHKA